MFRARSRLLHLVACSPSIAPPPADLAPTAHYTGAWVDPIPPGPLPPALEEFLSAGTAPVVVTFGSMAAPDPAALAQAVIDGVRDAGHRVVLQGAAPAEGPEVLVIGSADHRALFRRAAAVIHHGGAGTTHAAVAAGLPSVVVPHVGDQPYWAGRLHRLGVAPEPLDVTGITPAGVREAVELATAEPMRSAAQRLGQTVTAEQGVGSAIALIERALPT
jgi:sterol 3beta-glucosyltransferase